MRIRVACAIGHGQTLLSSFDHALHRCGVHNYNLLALSSVIPPGSIVDIDSRYMPERDEHGDRLYVVKAEARSNVAGSAIAAGMGWYQWGDGRGLFVEHEMVGNCADIARTEVESLILQSLRDLCAVRAIPFDEHLVGMATIADTVGQYPTTALAVAVYQSEPW